MLCEFDAGCPYAIVEYKRDGAHPTHFSHPTMRALHQLGDRAKLPFFLVVYTRDYAVFRVQAVNYFAREKLSQPREFSETKYVEFLLWLRGRQPNGQLF